MNNRILLTAMLICAGLAAVFLARRRLADI